MRAIRPARPPGKGIWLLETLHPELWGQRLRGIASAMAVRGDLDESAQLRRLYHLLALAPPALQQWFAPSLAEDVFEAVLRQSSQAAAFSLVGEQFQFQIASSRDGEVATVRLRLEVTGEEVSARDATIARAIVRAICKIGLRLLDL